MTRLQINHPELDLVLNRFIGNSDSVLHINMRQLLREFAEEIIDLTNQGQSVIVIENGTNSRGPM
jgi:hypothetical protein